LRSMVTLATTSSPVLTFLASMLLVSSTGITLPGAIREAEADCGELPLGDFGFCCDAGGTG
jgi:hypothetical protein